MKRALRIFVKMVTLPFVLMTFIMFYMISKAFVFQEWLFENKDPFWSYGDSHKEFMANYKKYLMDFFR